MLAWLGAALIGLALGLLGSGGSILTVPVLVYLVGEPEKLAIAESLAIVGSISLVGALSYAARGQVAWRAVVWFGLPGMLGTYLGSALSAYLPGALQLLLFAAVMLLAAAMMFRAAPQRLNLLPRSHFKTALEGLGVGVLTGLVGVGGGFLIIPALVVLSGLPMELAVGSSLAIITLNSLTGFLKHRQLLSGEGLHWQMMAVFSAIGILGSLLGARLGRQISHTNLRRGFAAFLVVMGVYVLSVNLPKVGLWP